MTFSLQATSTDEQQLVSKMLFLITPKNCLISTFLWNY